MLKTKIPFYLNDFFILGIFILALIPIYNFHFLIEETFSLYNIDLLILLLAVSLLLQKLRVGRKWWELGLAGDYTVLKNTVITIVYIIVTVIWFYLILLIFGVRISVAEDSLTSGFNVVNNIFIHLINSEFIPGYLSMFSLAVFEELIFRGLAFQIIEDKFGAAAAIISTSLIFAFIHLLNPNISFLAIFNTFLAGFILGNLYLKSRSLYIPIIYHFGWNFSLTFIIGSNLSGTNYNSGLTFYDPEHLSRLQEIFIGGHFGLEEGLAASIVLILLTAATSLWIEESPLIMSERFKRIYSNRLLPKSPEDGQLPQ